MAENGSAAAGRGEPDWLLRAREAQAIAQTGLSFTRDPYDRERFEALLALAARMMAAGAGDPGGADALADGFRREQGYATPKVDVRGAVFDAVPGGTARVLMVRELADGGRWTLPGGWADVNQTASECAVREVWEESGYRVAPSKLALLHDRGRQGHRPTGQFSITKLFFVCHLLRPEPERLDHNIETAEARFFAEAELPLDELSTGRVLPHQLERLFRHHERPELPTEFD